NLIPDGALNLFVGLLDLIEGDDFELLALRQGLYADQHFLGITNSNNALCGANQTCFADPSEILALFGADTPLPGTAFHTRSDGSIEKRLLPEPGTLGLFGVALAAFGFAGIRRRKA